MAWLKLCVLCSVTFIVHLLRKFLVVQDLKELCLCFLRRPKRQAVGNGMALNSSVPSCWCMSVILGQQAVEGCVPLRVVQTVGSTWGITFIVSYFSLSVIFQWLGNTQQRVKIFNGIVDCLMDSPRKNVS